MAKARPYFDQKRADDEARQRAEEEALRLRDERDAAELAMLRRRTISAYQEVPLGNGDVLRIRTGLTEPEYDFLVDLDVVEDGIRRAATAEGRSLTDDEVETIDEIMRTRVAFVTHNPLITPDWLRDHTDEFPMMDAVHAYQHVHPLVKVMAAKPENAAKFRQNAAR